ncbi:glutathione S-transferase [Comamonas sp. Tr-654]|uniref:glutathione S-transferase family protein n=1 Tax=Comamonas sp. Tr-654 TaxID=2608341 RepID=UPI001422A21F|nr:glutathione S-transferase [Comamonas sp. Tr-654]NIF82718.1 glutathione S-transferase [Comamonas sp. Tr-654]
MTAYRLHCFKESGNSYKVALALSIAGLPCDKVVVDYFGGETRLQTWRTEVNELGEVPVLEVDGQKLTQSGVILLHLAEHVGALRLSEGARPEVLRWLLFDNHKFTANLATYRWLRAFTTPTPHEAVLTFMRQRIASAFDIVEKHLGAQRFIVGDRLTIADLSLAGYVFYPKEELGFDISTEYPNMYAWMERLSQTSGWQAPYELLS